MKSKQLTRKLPAARSTVPKKLPDADEEGEAHLTWAEVQRTHRVRHGIYHRHEHLVSLLTDFGQINPCYPDAFADDNQQTISYTGEGRRGDQGLSPGNRALLAAIESGHSVPLFRKLAPGRWQHLGWWRVRAATHHYDEVEKRMLWRFTLEKQRSEVRG